MPTGIYGVVSQTNDGEYSDYLGLNGGIYRSTNNGKSSVFSVFESLRLRLFISSKKNSYHRFEIIMIDIKMKKFYFVSE